jgi:chemotaxis protein CheX
MTAACASLTTDCINPIVTSTVTVFRTMAGCDVTCGKPFLVGDKRGAHDISGVIGLSGRAIGTVVLSLGEPVALRVTEAMLNELPPEIDSDVIDAVGELTNMIAGSAKAQLEYLKMSLSLPNVVVGHDHKIAFPGDVTPIGVPFDCPWGPLCVQFGLSEKGN